MNMGVHDKKVRPSDQDTRIAGLTRSAAVICRGDDGRGGGRGEGSFCRRLSRAGASPLAMTPFPVASHRTGRAGSRIGLPDEIMPSATEMPLTVQGALVLLPASLVREAHVFPGTHLVLCGRATRRSRRVACRSIVAQARRAWSTRAVIWRTAIAALAVKTGRPPAARRSPPPARADATTGGSPNPGPDARRASRA